MAEREQSRPFEPDSVNTGGGKRMSFITAPQSGCCFLYHFARQTRLQHRAQSQEGVWIIEKKVSKHSK